MSDILEMFRIITFSIDHLEENGTPVDEKLAFQLEFQGFDHNDPLEGHMATYVEYQLRDDRWSELKPQIEQNDRGNSHARMLDTYMRMLGAVSPRHGQPQARIQSVRLPADARRAAAVMSRTSCWWTAVGW